MILIIIRILEEFRFTIIHMALGGFDPDINTGELAKTLFDISNGNMPDIFGMAWVLYHR